MTIQTLLDLIPYFISLAISLGVSLYAWRHRSQSGAGVYALNALGQALWTFGYVFELTNPDLKGKIFWDNFQWAGTMIVPTAAFIFAFQYTGRSLPYARRALPALASVPLLVLILAYTNSFHHILSINPRLVAGEPFSELTYDYGPAFWAIAVYVYGLMLTGMGILIQAMYRTHRLYRPQFVLVLIGMLIPLMGSFLAILNVTLEGHRDIAPLTFGVGNLFVAWALFRYRLLDIVPVARDKVVESMSDAVIVIDTQNRIVDLNPAALAILGKSGAEVVGKPADEVYAQWLPLVERFRQVLEARAKVDALVEGKVRCFDLTISPLYIHAQEVAGRLMVARDITLQEQAAELLQQYQGQLETMVADRTAELKASNEQLRREVVEHQRTWEALRRSEQEYRVMYTTAQRQAQELALLDLVRTALASEVSLPALFRAIIKSISETFGYSLVSLYLLDGSTLILQDQVGYEHCLEEISLTEGVTGRVARTGKPVLIEDVQSDPDFLPAMQGIVSEVCVPLMRDGHVVGILNVESTKGIKLSDADLHLIVALSKDIEIAVSRARLYQDIQQQLAERQRAEEALRVSQAEYRHLVDNSLQGMGIFQDGHFVFVNKALSNITGYGTDEMTAMSPQQTIDLVHPEDREWVVTNIRQHLAGLPVKPYVKHRFVRADGQIRTVEFLSSLITYRGKPAIQATYFDVTERVEAEQELERHREHLEELVEQRTAQLQQTSDRIAAILGSVGEAIMVVKPDGRIEQVNQAFEEQTGYAASEIERRNHRDFLFDDTMSREVFEASAHAMGTGAGWRGEMPVRRKDGSRYDAAVTITTMFNPSGERIAFVGILRDISALKEVERLKDAFVSNVSHELRTPITNIKLYLDLLDMKPEKYTHYLDILKRENNRLESLIEGLLTLSRLDQNRTTVNPAAVDLNELISEYVTDRSALAQDKRLKLTFTPISTLPKCEGDRNLLGQVLSILLTNALNYTPSGGKVRISTQTRQVEGQIWAGFSVTDTGPGIEPGETGKLFTRFFRGKAGLQSGVAGTGLGLAIAGEIVALHHGQIEALRNASRTKGATFRVWLPVEPLQS